MALTQIQAEAVYWIEQKFWETGLLVSNEKLSEHLDVNLGTVKGWWVSSDFREALVKRGVDLLDPSKSAEVLTPEQLQAANMMLNLHDTRSEREKLTELNLTPQKWMAWLRQPSFQGYLRHRAEAMFSANDYKVFAALVGEASGGDVSAMKLFFEMRGIYNPRVQVDVNVEVFMVNVFEIITKHVKDPKVLEAIANDFEALETGAPQTVGQRALPSAGIDI